MCRVKVSITIDKDLLKHLDELIARQWFLSRSHAIEEAIRELLNRLEHNRLAVECAKLDPDFERSMADEVTR